MADDQLSVVNNPQNVPIGLRRHSTEDDNIYVAEHELKSRKGSGNTTRVKYPSVYDDLKNNRVGGANLDVDEEDRGCTEFDREINNSSGATRYLPRLVFLDSEENISERTKVTQPSESNQEDLNDNSVALKQQRSVSDSNVNRFVTGFGPPVHGLGDYTEHTETRRNVLGPQSYSHSSVQSSDSELIIDHSLPVSAGTDDDFEQFMMEDDPRVQTWHCHSMAPKVPADKTARNQLIAVSVLCFLFMVGEAIGGAMSNSLALFTDVLHLGSDLISFLISLASIYLAKKPATRNMSFGYHRAEVIGALVSVFIIWSVTGVLVYMAIERIVHRHYMDVKPDEMLITAVLGVVFNIVMGIVLHSEVCCGKSGSVPSFGHGHSHGHSHGSHSHSHSNSNQSNNVQSNNRRGSNTNDGVYEPLLPNDDDNLQLVDEESLTNQETVVNIDQRDKPHPKNINVRAAFIHVLGDIIQSFGVLLASLIIKFKTEDKYRLADPICTFLFSLLVLLTTVTVLRDTLRIIMEGVPRDIDYYSIKTSLGKITGVKAVHGLTVWCLTLEKNALAVHLAVDSTVSHKFVLYEASEILRRDYNLLHSTIQVEDFRSDIMAKCTDCLELYK